MGGRPHNGVLVALLDELLLHIQLLLAQHPGKGFLGLGAGQAGLVEVLTSQRNGLVQIPLQQAHVPGELCVAGAALLPPGPSVSGGEPLLQIDFLTELFKKAKENGIHTTLDTSGNPFTREEPFFSKFNELMQYTDLILLDIKHIDEKEHIRLTGHTNKNILDLATYLSDMKKPVWIRHVLVPKRNDKDEYLDRLHEFILTLHNVERVEILPYHTLGAYKWKELGMEYPLEGIDPPTAERVENARKRLGAF